MDEPTNESLALISWGQDWVGRDQRGKVDAVLELKSVGSIEKT